MSCRCPVMVHHRMAVFDKVGVRYTDQHNPATVLELGDTGPDALHELSGFGGREVLSLRLVRDPVGDAFQFAVDESRGLPGSHRSPRATHQASCSQLASLHINISSRPLLSGNGATMLNTVP